MVWQSEGQDGDHGGIFAQRFDSAGARQGGEFRVNTLHASQPGRSRRRDGTRRRIHRGVAQLRAGRQTTSGSSGAVTTARASRRPPSSRSTATPPASRWGRASSSPCPASSSWCGAATRMAAVLRRLRPARGSERTPGRRVPDQRLHHQRADAAPRSPPPPTAASSWSGRARTTALRPASSAGGSIRWERR